MAKPTPIKLPCDLEREAEEERLQAIQERITKDRENDTLIQSLIAFLRTFEVKIIEFNQYINLYTPYPTISQTIKNIIRNKLRILNEFYFSYSGSNPHHIICECFKKDNADVKELQELYIRMGDILHRLNNNVLNISNKEVLFISKRPRKEESYDWA